MHKINRQQGISLLEVMLVMLISVSLSVGGVYGWQRLRQQQHLMQTVQQVQQFLARMRDDANWHNRNHFLWLATTAEGWCLGSSASQTEDDPHCSADADWQLFMPFAGVTVTDITPGLAFYGLRNTARAGHVTLQSPAGEWRLVVSDWGRIRRCSVNGKPAC